MSIQTKNWTVQIDRMPGAASFRVFGTVTVANSGITPKLVPSQIQDTPFLPLELVLEPADGVSLPVLTDKVVEYKIPGNHAITSVGIFYDGGLLHHIDEILITD
ncbi:MULTISPECIES: hypothetical protein [unclassified Pseudomonas]|uniref:hypothetical protein n=1 Tax=unclassified Pseudomonas TaxID=196821 RepID=UPI001CC12E47|nr:MULTISPECIES: hypothetical protein [unclassified Pseudomonas]